MNNLICIISLRNLGDAVIQSSYIRAMASEALDVTWLIWTRPESKSFFESIPNSRVITSFFLFRKDISARNLIQLIKTALSIKANKPSATIDFFGDWRELLLAKIIGAKRHIAPNWANDHVYKRLIKSPSFCFDRTFSVGIDEVNVYKIYARFCEFILSTINPEMKFRNIDPHITKNHHFSSRANLVIGIHPFASQACRMWPMERWVALASLLISRGFHVRLISSPFERDELERHFSPILSKLSVISVDLQNLSTQVEKLDLLIGLDSFSVHLANSLNVRNIMINGANNPDIYRTPLSYVISNNGKCSKFPCYNKPSCLGSLSEFSCIRSITVEEVFELAIRLFPDQVTELNT